VAGTTALSNTLDVTGATTLSNTLDVTGATTLSNTLDVAGNTSIVGDFDVSGGNTTISGDTAVTINATSGAISIGNDANNVDINVGTVGDRIISIGRSAPGNSKLKFFGAGAGQGAYKCTLFTTDASGALPGTTPGTVSVGTVTSNSGDADFTTTRDAINVLTEKVNVILKGLHSFGLFK
jgi:flagellar hook assembly protein FlgD